MLWKRSNVKPLATIPFFNILDKIDNFARMMICCAIPVPTSQYILTQKSDQLYLKFSAELKKLSPRF